MRLSFYGGNNARLAIQMRIFTRAAFHHPIKFCFSDCAGEKIFSEGDFSFPFYIIVASDETAETAGVEVLKDAGGSERLMTRLHRGANDTALLLLTLRGEVMTNR